MYAVTEVPQHLGRASFPYTYIDCTYIKACLRSYKPRHRRKEGDLDTPCFQWNRHSL